MCTSYLNSQKLIVILKNLTKQDITNATNQIQMTIWRLPGNKGFTDRWKGKYLRWA